MMGQKKKFQQERKNMSYSDIFKSSFLEKVTAVSVTDIVIAMLLAFCVGMFIFFVYKKTYTGVMYSAGFGTTLVALTMIATLVILAVTSNVVLSLGMVGALSIVRFRAAIKEPLDIAFLFWSIGAGIVLAAGMVPLCVLGSLAIGIFLLIFANKKAHTAPYMLVFDVDGVASEKTALNFIDQHTKKVKVKAKTVRPEKTELTIECRLSDANTSFVNELAQLEGLSDVALISYNGEYQG